MPILYAIVGGMAAGTMAGFVVALFASLPHLGWAASLVQPVFLLTAIGSCVMIAVKSTAR